MKWTSLFSVPLALLLPPLISAADSDRYATFVYNSTGSADYAFVFSLNAVRSTGDLFFHIENTDAETWAAVGFGSQMAGSLMLVAYRSGNGSGVTISPRIASGHAEPSYTSSVTVDKIWDSGLESPDTIDLRHDTMYVDGVCRNCTSWASGSLDLTDTQAPFIFAFGPAQPEMRSDDPAAGMYRHALYGHFTMDMTAATSQSEGAVPLPPYRQNMTSAAENTSVDGEFAPRAHAVLMVVSWLVLFPLGSLLLRLFDKVKLHAVVQGLGVVLVLIGSGLGVSTGLQYNRTRNLQSVHQIIGLVMVVALLLQLGLGILNHRIFQRTQRRTIMGKIHLFLGPALILLAVFNGGAGIKLAGATLQMMTYAIAVFVLILIYIIARTTMYCVRRRRARKRNAKNAAPTPARGGGDGSEHPDFAAYPSSLRCNTPHGQHIPLTPYRSTDSVPLVHDPAAMPRTMV